MRASAGSNFHKTLSPLGDSSVLIHFSDEIDLATNLRVHALDARLRLASIPGVIETVPAYSTILVHYDPLRTSYTEVATLLSEEIARQEQPAARKSRRIEVPVQYGGEAGPDLPFVAESHHATPREVVRLHTGRDYTVFMMGFTPGFPYMGTLPQELATPRLQTPRTRVPTGSVGIAGSQTGIYPIDSPGGWQIIGRTSLRLFDPAADEPLLFAPGDTVRFMAETIDA